MLCSHGHPARTRILAAVAVLMLLVAWPTVAPAQWTVVNLHPAGVTGSHATGVGGGQQVGYTGDRASLWNGTAASWVNLHPPAANRSYAHGANDGQQVGLVYFDSAPFARAGLWSGSAASWVDLNPHPSGSRATAVAGGQQVGSVFVVGGHGHASLWTGTAASWVDLNPAIAGTSVAYGVDGLQQVGTASAGAFGGQHASLWAGTAASWIDLHPAGAGADSAALAVHAGQQVGWVQVDYSSVHASLWSGTAPSWVDLHPVGAPGVSERYSHATAVNSGYQVGWVLIPDGFAEDTLASFWTGTAASWVNLHSFLPTEFVNSTATGITCDAGTITVVGSGFNTLTGRTEALMWIYADNQPPVIACNSPVVLWSPNHELVDASAAFGVSDPDGDPVQVSIRVFSDETEVPGTGDGTGQHAPDFKTQLASGAQGLFLRSERRGPEDGRFYLGLITADDGNGGVTQQVCILAVCPRDQTQVSLDDVLAQAAGAAGAMDFPTGLHEHGLSEPLGPNQ